MEGELLESEVQSRTVRAGKKNTEYLYSVEVKNFGRSNLHNTGTEMNLISLILLEKVFGVWSVFRMFCT